jgi:hypothetical protein
MEFFGIPGLSDSFSKGFCLVFFLYFTFFYRLCFLQCFFSCFCLLVPLSTLFNFFEIYLAQWSLGVLGFDFTALGMLKSTWGGDFWSLLSVAASLRAVVMVQCWSGDT